jgi:hypothetical protein
MSLSVPPQHAKLQQNKQNPTSLILLIIMSFLQQLTSFTNEDTQTDSSHASSSSLDMMISFTRDNI